jgi:hypothetical protein
VLVSSGADASIGMMAGRSAVALQGSKTCWIIHVPERVIADEHEGSPRSDG